MVATEEDLTNLKVGDRLKYYGVEWQVKEYSTYTDPNGYETQEWLLSSQTRKEYYLLREWDAQNPVLTHWYIAEELRQPTLIDPESQRDVLTSIWHDIQQHQTPYPKLQTFNQIYFFESETEGTYESEERISKRVTWDYWDEAHRWNLALETWEDGSLSVYSVRKVQTSDISEIQTDSGTFQPSSRSMSKLRQNEVRSFQLLVAWFVTILGVIIMLAGF